MTSSFSRRDFLLSTGAGTLGYGLSRTAFAQEPRLNISRSAARPDKPNIVVIIIDTLRRDHIGVYGNSWIRTPSLDELAAHSLRMTHAVPEAMPTIPARRSIHSGMRTFPFRDWQRRSGNASGVWGWQHIPDDQRTLAEYMTEAGYETLLVSDVPHQFKASMNLVRGFGAVQWVRGQEGDDYQPYWASPAYNLERFLYRDARGEELSTKMGSQPLARELRQYLANTNDRTSEEDYFAARVFRTAARLLEDLPPDRPFFLTVDSR